MSTTPDQVSTVSFAKSLGLSVAKKTAQRSKLAAAAPPPPTPDIDSEAPPDDNEDDNEDEPEAPQYQEDPVDPIEDSQAEEEPPAKKPVKKARKPAAKKAKLDVVPASVDDEFTLQMSPRNGIALEPIKGSNNSTIRLLKLLYSPPQPTVYAWPVAAKPGFVPRREDVFRAWVRYTQKDKSTSDHFIQLVKTVKQAEGKDEDGNPLPDMIRFRWLNTAAELQLLHTLDLRNGALFTNDGKNIERINRYHNRLPVASFGKREGFVSDHVAQALTRELYGSPLDFYQEAELLEGELDIYMPTDILNTPGAAERAEQDAIDGLVEDEQQQQDDEEPGVANPDDGDVNVVPWTDRPPHKTAKPAAAKKAAPKSRVKAIAASGMRIFSALFFTRLGSFCKA